MTNDKKPNQLLAPGYTAEEGAHHYHDEDGQLMIDFTGDKEASEILRGEVATASDIDPSNGYPKHLVWTTKDGRKIPIPHMQDSHLQNTIAFLRRRVNDVYKPNHLKHLLKHLFKISFRLNMFDHMDPEEVDDVMLEAKQKLGHEGKRILALSDDDYLREFSPQFSYLMQEAYHRKLIIESHDPTILEQRHDRNN